MAAPIKNNLPPQSQQWVRDMERRVAALERDNRVLNATVVKNATQIGSIQGALSEAQTALLLATSGADATSVEVTRSGSGDVLDMPVSVPVPSWAVRGAVVVNAGLFTVGSVSTGTAGLSTTVSQRVGTNDFTVVTTPLVSIELPGFLSYEVSSISRGQVFPVNPGATELILDILGNYDSIGAGSVRMYSDMLVVWFADNLESD